MEEEEEEEEELEEEEEEEEEGAERENKGLRHLASGRLPLLRTGQVTTPASRSRSHCSRSRWHKP